jgi:hypothetical protein
MTGLFIQSLNEVINLHAKRVMADLRSPYPRKHLGCALLVTILSMAALSQGYRPGPGQLHGGGSDFTSEFQCPDGAS